MKIIKYQLCTEINHGTEEHPNIEQVFSGVSNRWSEANEAIAKAEAYNGEYTIDSKHIAKKLLENDALLAGTLDQESL